MGKEKNGRTGHLTRGKKGGEDGDNKGQRASKKKHGARKEIIFER